MSKKIIYLLSLLMVLSLVFASCKKNNPLSAAGGIQKPDTITPPSDGLTGGLFTDKEKFDEYATKVVQASEIDKYANKDYKRNPVITVLDGQSVLIVYEIRYQSAGSGNDVALTGTNSVDIAYKLSTDGGVSFENGGQPTIIDKAGSDGDAIKESHGAPIVYNTGKHVIIVASAGIGLSVGTYKNDGDAEQSWLEYTYAEIKQSSDGNGPTLGTFAPWAKIDGITMNNINTDMGKGNTPFKQYGTHTSRGVVVTGTSTKILLPVTVAEFIQNSNGWGDSRWGYIVYSLTVGDNGQLTAPTKQGTGAEMDIRNHKTKTTRVAAATSESKFTTLTVSDNSSNLVLYKGENGTGSTATTIKGGDGSPGILVVDKWVGGTYDPNEYAAGSGTISGEKKTLLSHVLELEKNVAIREVTSDFSADVSGTYFKLGGVYATASKSSSIDILKDGTIVMAVEGGKVETGVSGRPFYIYFNRYTQAYLASQMGN